ncbi:MAG: peptidoglycan DD-metalloendopeptidase family protein [Burkholderiales bacterium]|nr:peptidoglycan DD-metalloendopeptidase family protein [Burkholderiales bacterium]
MTKLPRHPASRLFGWTALACALALTGCASTRAPAPVEDRATARPPARPATPADAAKAAPAPAPAASGADTRPATYTVKPGDTLMRIALESGQAWRDIARWNGIENPNLIEVGQVLRVLPPTGEVLATKPVTTPKIEAKPLDAAGAKPSTPAASGAAATPASAPAVPAKDNDDDVQWAWPAAGPVAAAFDENRNKGLAITGKAGDPVYAAADGRVVYAGSGLRGYGNLVIVKHNATYLTAYAHNQTLLVKEDQVVRKGQKIAEMGSSDAERVQLHFEVRRQGKPIDPAKLLPAR